MTKRTKKRNTKKRLSRKSSKRRVMRGGMFGSILEKRKGSPTVAGFEYAYINKDNAIVYYFNDPSKSYPEDLGRTDRGKRMGEIVKMVINAQGCTFLTGEEKDIIERKATEGKVYVMFGDRVWSRSMVGWMNKGDLTVIPQNMYKTIDPEHGLEMWGGDRSMLTQEQIRMLQAGTPEPETGLEPTGYQVAEAGRLSINTTSYNGWGADVQQKPDYIAPVNVMPTTGVGSARSGELFLENATDKPNLILRYQQGGLSSVGTYMGFDPQYRYIFIKGKVGRDNLYVGNEINISNKTPKDQDKVLKIILTERSDNIQRLLDSLPVHSG